MQSLSYFETPTDSLFTSDFGCRSAICVLYMCAINFSGMFFSLRLYHMNSLGIVSYAFSKSTNIKCSSCCFSLHSSINNFIVNIGSIVDFPGWKPY